VQTAYWGSRILKCFSTKESIRRLLALHTLPPLSESRTTVRSGLSRIRIVKGLQIADLVAHTSGLMLLDSLGLLKKVVKAGPNSGYDENLEIDLGFEMWASLRYQFFNAGSVVNQDDLYAGALVKVGANGLFVAASCPPELRAAAESRCDECYLGCIH
jgi:hypothetical protein